jgi:hypothetical protein
MSTKLFPSNSCFTVAHLHSCYLAVGLHVTVCWFVVLCFHENHSHSVTVGQKMSLFQLVLQCCPLLKQVPPNSCCYCSCYAYTSCIRLSF